MQVSIVNDTIVHNPSVNSRIILYMVSCSVTGGTSARTSFKGFSLMEYNFITKLKSNMKGALMSVSDRLLLTKRAIIETVNDELKNIAQVEHSRHRCFDKFIVNLLGAIAAY